jgi:alginate O-acetyltransferase complex protein AlgI
MANVNLLLVFTAIVLSIFIMQFFNKKHYWKITLSVSLIFVLLLTREGFIVILYIAFLTYYFSLNINTINHLKWWMIGLVLFPLVVKKIYIPEHQFNDLMNPLDSGKLLLNIVGLSYITFNAIGYLMDLKRKYIKPEKNFWKLLLYLTYFPIIFSGPLTRAKHFFLEIENIQFKRESVVNGLRLIIWGAFKNLVVGSRLFKLLIQLLGLELRGLYYLFNGFVFYLFLYCTFSSFINIFQGISLIFNVRLNENFKNRIYLSASRDEFWKGWHISLNQWFRDYFFYEILPLDKKRKHTNLLLFITFLCIALWHDFTLVFFIWGTLNALWLILERKYKKNIKTKPAFSFLGIIYHSVIASFFATIFISRDIFDLGRALFDLSEKKYPFEQLLVPNTLILIITFGIMDYYEKKTTNIRIDKYIAKLDILNRYIFYYLMCLLILFFGDNPKLINYYNLF